MATPMHHPSKKPPRYTLRQCLEDFIADRKRKGRAEGTVHSYGDKKKNILRLIDPDIDINDLTLKAIERCSPNDLRRTFGSWLKNRGLDSAVVARLMGHSSTRMVDLVYGKLDDETLARAMAKLGDVTAQP